MFLKKLSIEGYKHFGKPFQVEFGAGLSVLVGENGSGKTAIIDAIRLLLLEHEYGRRGVTDTDFNKAFSKGATSASTIKIVASFDGLSKEETVACLPWAIGDNEASLNLEVENKETPRGGFRPVRWGGVSRASMFEPELLEKINCIYLPPMRDAESKLREGKGSRLARLLKTLNSSLLASGTHPLEAEVTGFNRKLAFEKGKAIDDANARIRQALLEAVGKVFGQDTLIQFSESSFNRIVENLRLFFFRSFQEKPDPELFRSLEENSLGYNNLLYLATVLAQLSSEAAREDFLRVLLIEEPEAHLHPQLQIRLLKHLEQTARKQGIQVIVTTHSPVLAAAVSLKTIIHLSLTSDGTARAVPIRKCSLGTDSEAFISRWLDATKSNLLFARSVILVEGIAEALMLPELARRALADYNSGKKPDDQLPPSLEDAGVAVINMGGIYFKHFMQLFSSIDGLGTEHLPIRCVGITDADPPDEKTEPDGRTKTPINPTPMAKSAGENHALKLIPVFEKSKTTRLYANQLKTFEYDLAMETANTKIMLSVAAECAKRAEKPKIRGELAIRAAKDWGARVDPNVRAAAARYLLEHIDKGEFAQLLASYLSSLEAGESFTVPAYIAKAVLWACGKSL